MASTRNKTANVQTLTLAGQRFVILPERDYRRLAGEPSEPLVPKPDARGFYPAREATDALIARDILRSRRWLGLTQAELARRAGIRTETLNRIERGARSPNVATLAKIDRALTKAEREDGQ